MMKKWMALALLALMLLAACVSAGADGEGVIVQSSCNIVKSGDYYLVYCYAQVHNNSDEIICLDHGTFDLTNGEQLLSTGEVTQLWPYFLSPGEDGYVFDIVSFEPNEDGVVVPNVTGIHYNIHYMTIDPAYAGQDLSVISHIETEPGGEQYVVCEVTNPTSITAYDPTVAFGMYTDEGSMIYADGTMLKNVGVPAGGTVMVRFDIDELFTQQWNSYGAQPSEARAQAMFRSNDD